LIEDDTQPREVGDWLVSSFSNGNASCVQVRFAEPGAILVRDSKDRCPASPIISLPSPGWTALLTSIDRPA
jgi:hypothetical protein